MNSGALTVKLEPPDDFDAGSSEKVSSPALQNGITENGEQSSASIARKSSFHDSRNFTCLLCDIVCSNRDDLRKHLKNLHASKSYSTMSGAMFLSKLSSDTSSRSFSGYVNYRYTCPICGAKFKSFRTYLTHNMSHRGNSGLQPFDEARMAALFGNGKQYMQDYLEAEENCAGTFTCTECETVFVQRDAYAMHMMMRAMNETCKSNSALNMNSSESGNDEKDPKFKTDGTENPETNQVQLLVPTQTDQAHQRCLEDVTAKVDQDEYLKSVLDKVVVSDGTKLDVTNFNMDERKVCSFCSESFVDQDCLAMHVMSDHANEMSLSNNRNNVVLRGSNPEDYINWVAIARSQMLNFICRYCNETFVSRDSLALHMLTHAHLDEKSSKINFKRKMEVIEASSSASQSQKIIRLDTEQDTAKYNGFPDVIEKSRHGEEYHMYCKQCEIKFYALSEYEWHMGRHREGSVISYDRPLCLTKTTDTKYSTNLKEHLNNTFEDNNRRRRNSFSCSNQTDNVATSDSLPKRPVSVGDCSSDTLKRFRNSRAEHPRTRLRKEAKAPVSNSSVLDTINALSSSEQRIIYSVFGTDLGLPVTKPEGTPPRSHSCSPPVDLSSAKQNNAEEEKNYIRKEMNTDLKDEDGEMTVSVSGLTKSNVSEEKHRLTPGDSTHPMCKYCEILFFNKAIYYLHMGLHNVNNPWQCNICGKICKDAVDFAAHVIHM